MEKIFQYILTGLTTNNKQNGCNEGQHKMHKQTVVVYSGGIFLSEANEEKSSDLS